MNNIIAPETMQPETAFKYKRLMIIDDNETDRYICDRASKTFRFSEKVVGIESGIEALRYLSDLKENPEELPELIFLDINMPEMNGFEFLDAYKELPEAIRKSCIIVMLTSSTHEEDRKRIQGNEYVKAYLNKPLTRDKMSML